MPKKIILIIVITGLILFGLWQVFFKKEEPVFSLAEVSRGTLIQEVSETGQVRQGEEIDLSFNGSGKIEEIYVKAGDKVEAGQTLAKLDISSLSIQLKEAKSALAGCQAKLDKLMAGASPEEIQKAKTAVSNSEISLENAKQSLEDIEAKAKENLDAAYEDALNILDDVYLKVYNAKISIDSMQRTYFTENDRGGVKVKENKSEITLAVSKIKFYLDQAKESSTKEDVDLALAQSRDRLVRIYESLKIIREVCQNSTYRDIVSDTDRSSLDTYKTNVNTALTNVVNCQQTISLTKVTNETNINTGKSKVLAAEGAVQAAKDQLALITASPHQADIDLDQAQVEKAQAQVQLLENQIAQAHLKAPVAGQIIKVFKELGEQVQSMAKDAVISLVPFEPFQIEVDIPEVDIGKIDLGDACKITLDAQPETEYSGRVIEIEPAETVIQGVVYYRTRVGLDYNLPEESGSAVRKIKPGMTANLTIITAQRENVLFVPQRAVVEKNGKKLVRIPVDNTFQEVEVQTGLRGSEGEIEIISGLEEGDRIITFIKER